MEATTALPRGRKLSQQRGGRRAREESRQPTTSELREIAEGLRRDVAKEDARCRRLQADLEPALSRIEEEILAEERHRKVEIEAKRRELLEQVKTIREYLWRSWSEKRRECEGVLRLLSGCAINGNGVPANAANVRRLQALVSRLSESVQDGCVRFVEIGAPEIGRLLLPPCADKTSIEAGGGAAVARVVNSFVVTVRDPLGRIASEGKQEVSVSVVDGNGQAVNATVEDLKTGRHRVRFYPESPGRLTAVVKLNSVAIPGSPKEIAVVDGAASSPALAIGESGDDEGQFARPWGVCCDSRGRILVTDRCNNRIQIFTDRGYYFKFGSGGSAPGELNRPAGIAVDKWDRIIVADKDNHRIQIFDRNGDYVTHFGKCDAEGESLEFPWDVAATESCDIAVAETSKRRVTLFSDSGVRLRRFESDSVSPRGIACRPDGSFLVTDFNGHKIVALDAELEKVDVIGGPGSKMAQFQRPQGVAVWNDRVFAVSDGKNHRVQVFRNGIVCHVIGKFGSGEGEFDTPQGVAFHPDGSLVVVDLGNNRVQIFKP